MSIDQYTSVLKSNPWLASLPDKAIAQLVEYCQPIALSAGQLLYSRDDEADGFHIVLDGQVRVSNINKDGKEAVLTYLENSACFGEISLFDGLPRTHDTRAEIDTQLLLIPIKSFHKLLQLYPELYPSFLQLLCQRIRATFSLIEESSTLTLRQRLARRLMLLADNFGSRPLGAEPTHVRVSQDSLAKMLNTSRQTINKHLQLLQREKMIALEYGRIKLLSPARIRTEYQ
ncbi:MAG: Crp/Fnr family transcriptional regulator [Kangiellaceae bacterium]|jgi:CRP-like cAMP-binding protein|nr:Crp/Fnr family transcriptional regulator [Kangiellaceae bacterium]